MCRIAGVLTLDEKPIVEPEVIAMRDTMTKGGPDDAGLWIDSNYRVGFGHRRLSILDLSSAGHQPMHTPDGRYTICYNGEIYNFRAIREELQKNGAFFHSDCDTEVLLHAFAAEGINCLHRFHGMFSFAIWDSQDKNLTLVRDRIGVKPLYYARQNGIFLFASELKAIMAHPSFERKISTEALELFLQYSYIPHPFSILQNTNKLGPGQWLTIDAKGKTEIGTWWSLSASVVTDFDWKDQSAVERELEERLFRSFEMRMVADVPVGVFLSGGIDSSLLLALLSQHSTSKINTFTIGFDEGEYNEAHYAKKVAAALSSEHHELYLKPERGLEIIGLIPEIWDEPFGDNSAIATYLVCEFAVKHVKVALSADGGDELFCGYPKYWLTQQRVESMHKHKLLCQLIAKIPSSILESVGRKITGNKLLKIKDLTDLKGDLEKNSFIYGQHVFSDFQLKRLIKGSTHKIWLPQAQIWENFLLSDPLVKMMAVDLCSYHTDDIHVKVDRASMSNSLEAREPLLDHEIVEFAFGMPSHYKLPGNDTTKSKNILRKILYKYIDKDLIERPKMGFGVPLDKWLNSELQSLVDICLSPKLLEEQGIFDPHYVQQIRVSFARNPKQELNKIWNLIVFQMWYKRWM